jgi:transposase-like protein
VWLYFRFPLSLRMVEEMLAARGISVTHETIRQWGLKFGRVFANRVSERPAGEPVVQGADQTRLADTRLAVHQDHLALAGNRSLPAA